MTDHTTLSRHFRRIKAAAKEGDTLLRVNEDVEWPLHIIARNSQLLMTVLEAEATRDGSDDALFRACAELAEDIGAAADQLQTSITITRNLGQVLLSGEWPSGQPAVTGGA